MRSKNRMHTFFMVLFLLFWNPLSLYFIYGNTAVQDLKLIHFLFWTTLSYGLIFLFLLITNKISGKWLNALLFINITGILFSIIVMVDGAIGLTLSTKAQTGLLLEPWSKIRFQTAEFDYMAETNSIGLRDKEIPAGKGSSYRILCVGDSWTYGWGVDIGDSWPKKLELFLKSKGFTNAEVINCGQPGRYSTTYLTNLEKLLPVLKPDLVLLGVLQLDDLAQLHEERFPPPGRVKEKVNTGTKIIYAISTFLSCSVKNILTLTKKRKHVEISLKGSWKNSVAKMINNFSAEQQQRYNMLSDSVKAMLREGDLTPGFLYYFINYPDRAAVFSNADHNATRFAIVEMNKDISAIKDLCHKNNAGLIFLDLPVHYFTGHKVISGAGNIPDTTLQRNDTIDSLYRSVALKNVIPYLEMTKLFRNLEDKSGYFFRYDGHPNKKGYEKIADLVGQYLIDSNRIK